jgi:hypothetical protein
MNDTASRLPRILCSSVVRSVHQGESHGGLYLVDLEKGQSEQVLDWTDANINWEGRGGDRGLRGIAFHNGLIYLAASDEVFVYDRAFAQQGSFRNPYLHMCHEIFVDGDRLYLASTGFDSVLEYDLKAAAFTRGWTVRFAKIWKPRHVLHLKPRPSFRAFDPNGADGPVAGDSSHVNNTGVYDGTLFVSGTALPWLYRIANGRLERYARTSYGTHNARPFRDGALFNHTRTDRIVYAGPTGEVVASVPLPTYPPEELEHADLPEDLARPTFGRGLTVLPDGRLVGGSSPATITVYDLDAGVALTSVNISMDVRNAVHGLEVWPFDDQSP